MDTSMYFVHTDKTSWLCHSTNCKNKKFTRKIFLKRLCKLLVLAMVVNTQCLDYPLYKSLFRQIQKGNYLFSQLYLPVWSDSSYLGLCENLKSCSDYPNLLHYNSNCTQHIHCVWQYSKQVHPANVIQDNKDLWSSMIK